jgi:hypothetical protein
VSETVDSLGSDQRDPARVTPADLTDHAERLLERAGFTLRSILSRLTSADASDSPTLTALHAGWTSANEATR